MEVFLCIEYAVAGIIRYLLANSEYQDRIAARVEISTPLNSWKRVTEGIHLFNEGINPYVGNLFHETPLGLFIFNWMSQKIPSWIQIVFIVSDLFTAHLLYLTAKEFTKDLFKRQQKDTTKYAKGFSVLLLKESDLKFAPVYTMSAYLFNPYLIFNCVSQTTTVFANLNLAFMLLCMVKGNRFLCCVALALATLQSLYPFILLVPAAIYLERISGRRLSIALYHTITLIMYLASLLGFLHLSKVLSGGWEFLDSIYGFIITVPDLRPNIGLFWYFFTEMFEHFRWLFIWSFQINAALLYVVPLTLRLKAEPMLLAVSLCALSTVFKSYPSLGDVGFYLALMPMWKHLFNYMQQGFVVSCFFLITSVLGPILWHLWIYSRSANANFYFGVTLAFATAQIFLITDILFAYIKRDFTLYCGSSKEQSAKLVLD